MPINALIMLFLLIALVLVPIRLSALQLKGLAFFLWFLGGLVLTFRGVNFMFSAPDQPGWTLMAVITVVALIIGMAKGQFVLAKTSRRNIDRLNALQEPMRPIYVYEFRSWLIIGLMTLIGVGLNFLPPSLILLRGAVNLAIGAALIMSSLAYLKALVPPEPASLPPDSHNIGPGVGP
jgi:hypothetical protein